MAVIFKQRCQHYFRTFSIGILVQLSEMPTRLLYQEPGNQFVF